VQWVAPGVEQVAQSGWQGVQVVLLTWTEANGHEEAHVPLYAIPAVQLVQYSAAPEQVAHLELHAAHVPFSIMYWLGAHAPTAQVPFDVR
jgi:hypothetical protein